MNDEQKRKLHEAQINLADAARSIDAASIQIRSVLNGNNKPAGKRTGKPSNDR